jgi:hypothetical protein
MDGERVKAEAALLPSKIGLQKDLQARIQAKEGLNAAFDQLF